MSFETNRTAFRLIRFGRTSGDLLAMTRSNGRMRIACLLFSFRYFSFLLDGKWERSFDLSLCVCEYDDDLRLINGVKVSVSLICHRLCVCQSCFFFFNACYQSVMGYVRPAVCVCVRSLVYTHSPPTRFCVWEHFKMAALRIVHLLLSNYFLMALASSQTTMAFYVEFLVDKCQLSYLLVRQRQLNFISNGQSTAKNKTFLQVFLKKENNPKPLGEWILLCGNKIVRGGGSGPLHSYAQCLIDRLAILISLPNSSDGQWRKHCCLLISKFIYNLAEFFSVWGGRFRSSCRTP